MVFQLYQIGRSVLSNVISARNVQFSRSVVSCIHFLVAVECSWSRSSNLAVQTINTCNCRDKRSCPMDGNCNERNIIYQAEVTTSHSKQTYIGLCDTSFKSRYRNHTCSFRNERYRNSTELSNYVWGLKDKKTDYQIRWRSIRHARSYSNVTKKCNLCLWEKYNL